MQIQDWDQGVNTVEARWTDVAGNTSAVVADTIKIEQHYPVRHGAVVRCHDLDDSPSTSLPATRTGSPASCFSCDGGASLLGPFAA